MLVGARLTNRLISTLPERGRTLPKVRDALWSEVLGGAPGTDAPASAARAFESYQDCRGRAENGTIALRTCLAAAHDKFIGDLNNQYWDATKYGF